jgi:tRNA A37 threonylcarbamoyladenosine synthetase subunit TsaC/SUA5/YrdC
MPDNRVTLDLIQEAGPLAVSSANLTGRPAATSVLEAERMLRSSVSVYLDDGPSNTGVASTIIDATALARREENARIRVLRAGAVSTERLRELLGDTLESDASETGTTA